MRPFATMTALALALLPAAAFAQNPPQQPPATPPAAQTPAPAQPTAPKLAFKSNAGILLIQVKPDSTAAFEEMMTKLKASMMSSTDATIKSQASFKVYKSADPDRRATCSMCSSPIPRFRTPSTSSSRSSTSR